MNPPSRLRRRILASVGVTPERTWLLAAVAVAACCLVVAVFFGWRGQQQRRELAVSRVLIETAAAQKAQLQEALDLLNLPETRVVNFGGAEPQPPRGRVLVNPSRGVLLVASNLPPVPAGRTYELWIIPKGQAPTPAGLFQATPGGTALVLHRGAFDMASISAVAVTVEPEAGSLAPTTKPLVVAAL